MLSTGAYTVSNGAGEGNDANHEIVQAYAKLDFGSKFAYYIQTLDVVIGRQASAYPCVSTDLHSVREPSSQRGTHEVSATSSGHATLSPSMSGNADHKRVDIDLGRLKSISRQHARLAYDFETEKWKLHVIGKNGVLVGDRFFGRGEVALLQDEIAIQICEITFTFRLPQAEETPNLDSSQSAILRHHLGAADFVEKAGAASRDQQRDQEVTVGSDRDPTTAKRKADRPPKPPHSYATLIYQAIDVSLQACPLHRC